MTMSEMLEKNICRIRNINWANPEAYAKFHIVEIDGKKYFGPWVKLYDRKTQEVIGASTPQMILSTRCNPDENDVEYTGPLDKDDQ